MFFFLLSILLFCQLCSVHWMFALYEKILWRGSLACSVFLSQWVLYTAAGMISLWKKSLNNINRKTGNNSIDNWVKLGTMFITWILLFYLNLTNPQKVYVYIYLSPYFKYGNQVLELWSNLSKVTQLLWGRSRIQAKFCLLHCPQFIHTSMPLSNLTFKSLSPLGPYPSLSFSSKNILLTLLEKSMHFKISDFLCLFSLSYLVHLANYFKHCRILIKSNLLLESSPDNQSTWRWSASSASSVLWK